MKRPAEQSAGCFRLHVLQYGMLPSPTRPALRVIDDVPVVMKNK
jgi:hypothetical protein